MLCRLPHPSAGRSSVMKTGATMFQCFCYIRSAQAIQSRDKDDLTVILPSFGENSLYSYDCSLREEYHKWHSHRSIRRVSITTPPPLTTTPPPIITIRRPTITNGASIKRRRSTRRRLSSIASLPTNIPRPPTVILTNDDGKRGFIEVAPKGQARNLRSSCRRGRSDLVADAGLVAPMDRRLLAPRPRRDARIIRSNPG